MKNFIKTISIIAAASFACLFTACGESTTNVFSDDGEEIADDEFDEEDEESDDELSSSSKKQEKSSSSKKAKSSSSSEKGKVSSSSKKVESSSSSEKDEKSSSSVKVEPAKLSGKVSGVSQKGPFILGSKVTLYEVEGESLDPSGSSFVSKIKNDKGEFEVSYKDLSSNYAMFVVDGYYRNEVTGKQSISPITLNALSDLTDRKTVNVNILTHLEFDRVKYLVGTKGVEYGKAKAQAEKEIFDAFGISFQEGSSAEDLSIVGTTENDGALLALSVLLQGSSAEAAFSERLARIAQDLEEDGTIDDKQILADIADEVALMDLAEVRKNIEGWKLSSSVSNFENYVESYRTASYDIGACTKEDVAKTAKNTNKLSKNYEKMYVCEESGWRVMTADEAKYGTCTANEDGKRFEKSRICDGGKWRSLTADESMGACTEEKIGETVVEENELSSNFGKKHVCDKKGWRVASNLEEKLGSCTSANAQQVLFDGDRLYVYRCVNSVWNVVDDVYEYDALTLVCNNEGEILHSERNDFYYVCREGKLTAPTFNDYVINKEFTADVWNGATDSKVKFDEKEYGIITWVASGDKKFSGHLYDFNGNEFLVDENNEQRISFPKYDDGGSEVVKEKGVKYSYEFSNSQWSEINTLFVMPAEGIDARDWDGLCVVYASSSPLVFSIASNNLYTEGWYDYAVIPASMELTVANLKWEEFNRSYEKGKAVDPMEAVAALTDIGVGVWQRSGLDLYSPMKGSVYIAGIGKYNGCSVK